MNIVMVKKVRNSERNPRAAPLPSVPAMKARISDEIFWDVPSLDA